MPLFNPPVFPYRAGGVDQPRVVIDKRTVVGPASYATGGMPVDLSAVFSKILAIRILRAYVTSTKSQAHNSVSLVFETGTDIFDNAKFRIMQARTYSVTPAGSVSAPTISLVSGAGLDASIRHQGNAQPMSNGGTGAVTGITGIQAPTFSGTFTSGAHAESSVGQNYSTITIEYEVVGVLL